MYGSAAYAQAGNPRQLGTEIQRLDQSLAAPGISAAERHEALTRLARLRQLSGDIAGAAANWLDAAASATPADEYALISGAYCLAALGEWEKTAAAIRPLLTAANQGHAVLRARYLDACLRAWVTADASILASLVTDAAFLALRPMIYYTLWQSLTQNPDIQGARTAEAWKSRLIAEFPKSPEARAANPARNATPASVSAVHGPLWMLLPGIIDTSFIETPAPSRNEPDLQKEPPAPNTPDLASLLQTGIFGKEANARAQADALQKAGFTARIITKSVNGVEYWAVTVPAGADSPKTMGALKAAGFDSFPVKGN